jgi:hypothetical protein
MYRDDNPYSPARLADRAEIQDVMFRWCRAIDRLDYEAIREVFHPDAIDYHGAYQGGVDGLIEWIRDRHRPIPFSMHLVGNLLIEFTGPDDAMVETYCLAMQRYPASGRTALTGLVGDMPANDSWASDLIVPARYVDHFRRIDGRWRIQTRHVAFDSVMLVDAPGAGPLDSDRLELGRRDRQDVIYRMRETAGLE